MHLVTTPTPGRKPPEPAEDATAPDVIGLTSLTGSTGSPGSVASTDEALARIKEQFEPVRGYLNAATLGLPPIPVAEAVREGVTRWQRGQASATAYDEDVKAARTAYARFVSVPPEWVAVGSQASVIAGMVASSLPDGAEVVCVKGDFASIQFPFMVHADRGITVRHVPLTELASSLTDRTALVAFSLVQSACGSVSDGPVIAAAARAVDALSFCDITQAAGWLPVDASDFDLTVCSAYKWMCQPRGTAYLTIRPEIVERVRPIHAGWYAGDQVWDSCYGPSMELARDARRFDVSPAWLSWVGAVPALEVMSMVPTGLIHDHNVGLAEALRSRIALAASDEPSPGSRAARSLAGAHASLSSPIVALADPTGEIAGRLAERGAKVSSRAGRVRIAFHIWNTPQDVDLVAAVLNSVIVQD